jgi:hypothetical protein
MALSSNNNVMRLLGGGIDILEVWCCGFILALGILAAAIVAARERRIDQA